MPIKDDCAEHKATVKPLHGQGTSLLWLMNIWNAGKWCR